MDRDPLIGRVIAGKLELLELIGAGAMGRVFRAHHRGLDVPVAVKVLSTALVPSLEGVQRFVAEARATSRLAHPNCVRILDFGEDGPDHLLYLAMEFLNGRNLHRVIREQAPFEERRACLILAQALAALATAHDHGIVHRDVKPANIMLCPRIGDSGAAEEHVKVCDFGVAKMLVRDEVPTVGPTTMDGAVVGTPAYMSPEQARGLLLDGRSDVYSIGIILYEMLSGQRPHDADTPMAMALKQISEEPVPVERLRPELSPGLAAIVRRALAKDPDDRFADARAFREALLAAAEGRSRAWRPRRLGLFLGGAALGGAALTGLALVRSRPAPVAAVAAVTAPVVDAGFVEVPDAGPALVEISFAGPPGAELIGPQGSLGFVSERGVFVLSLPRGETVLAFDFRLRGFRGTRVEVVPSASQVINVSMERERRADPVRPRDRLEDPFR